MTDTSIFRMPKKDAALFFGISIQSMDAWVVRGCPIAEKDDIGRVKLLDVREVARWKVKEQTDGALVVEKTRLTKAQADKTEIEIQVLRGDLFPAAVVERTWSAMTSAARQRLLAVPYRMATAVVSADTFEEIEAAATNLITEALSELHTFDPTDYQQCATARAGLDMEASPTADSKPMGRPRKAVKPGGKRGAGAMVN